LKSKLLLSLLTTVVTFSLPVAATCQVAPDRVPKVRTGPDYKYEAYAGWGYTSINQINQSRSGLQGVGYGLGRYFNDHFGVVFEGGHYQWSVSSTNPGSPTVDLFLAGPMIRANVYGKIDMFARGLLGGAHTGGVSISPNVSFAGGLGIGADYNKTARWAFRVYGDDIASSFTLTPFQPGFSPHKRWNARAGVGVVYHF
jgi:hypothetical protein